MFKWTLRIFYISSSSEMFKNLNCLIGLTNSDNLVIAVLRSSKFDLKYNFVGN